MQIRCTQTNKQTNKHSNKQTNTTSLLLTIVIGTKGPLGCLHVHCLCGPEVLGFGNLKRVRNIGSVSLARRFLHRAPPLQLKEILKAGLDGSHLPDWISVYMIKHVAKHFCPKPKA
jgi:hypothetical protein